jgi:hypothetical protein
MVALTGICTLVTGCGGDDDSTASPGNVAPSVTPSASTVAVPENDRPDLSSPQATLTSLIAYFNSTDSVTIDDLLTFTENVPAARTTFEGYLKDGPIKVRAGTSVVTPKSQVGAGTGQGATSYDVSIGGVEVCQNATCGAGTIEESFVFRLIGGQHLLDRASILYFLQPSILD